MYVGVPLIEFRRTQMRDVIAFCDIITTRHAERCDVMFASFSANIFASPSSSFIDVDTIKYLRELVFRMKYTPCSSKSSGSEKNMQKFDLANVHEMKSDCLFFIY